MIEIVFNKLKPIGLPIKFLQRPKFGITKTVISYHFFNQGDDNFGDGEPNEQTGSLQVDVFSKSDYTSIVTEVKALLKGAKFMYFDGNDDIEKISETEQIYHKILIFNYVESEVKE